MSVACLIPYRDIGCEHRTRALEYVTARLQAEHPWPLVIGRHDEGLWVKAHAISDALAQTQAEILIVADADCWTDGLAEAVARVEAGVAWAIPHRGVHRLNEDSTARWMAGEPLDGLPLAERAYLGVECGGVFVVRRDVYDATGFDPRFRGWGGDDDSLSYALRALYGPPWRGKAPLVHLHHPPQERACRNFGSMEGRDLRKRYARARGDADAMKRLIREVNAQCL